MAAGLGFKTFTTGEVLTAADVNGYLMQGILVFASSAARAAAITSPQEGQYSFLKDTNALEYYDGAAWVGAPVGDITAVTAGTGISGGGSSGDVTITNSMATAINAKADLIVGTADNAFDRLAVGTNGQVLTADSTVSPTGLKWSTISTTPSFIGVMCERSSGTISMTSGVDSIIPFTTEIADTNGFHDNSTNNTRFTVPTGYGGKYLVVGFGFLDVGSNARFTLRFYKNGSENQQTLLQQNINMASNNCALTGSRVVSLVAGDYLEFALRNDNTASPTVYAAFYMTYLGA